MSEMKDQSKPSREETLSFGKAKPAALVEYSELISQKMTPTCTQPKYSIPYHQ